MTAASFCKWVNETLLVQHNLDANLPCRISLRTATRWLHHLGFQIQSHKKGANEDVVKSHREFLLQIHNLKNTHLPPPICSDEQAVTPPADAETRKQLILIYHDESIFNINEGQPWMWATEDTPIIQPKTKGASVMVSDLWTNTDSSCNCRTKNTPTYLLRNQIFQSLHVSCSNME